MTNQVRDLTTEAIGKQYRIQNDDGAFIEGTLDSVNFGMFDDKQTVPEVIITFRELKTSYREGTKRTRILIYTRPQHTAIELVDDGYGGYKVPDIKEDKPEWNEPKTGPGR